MPSANRFRWPQVTFSEMLRLSSCARLLMMVMRSSLLPQILIQNNDEPPCTPCLSLSKYSSEAARDKALRKREGGAFAPPRWGFCTPLNWTSSVTFPFVPYPHQFKNGAYHERSRSAPTVVGSVCPDSKTVSCGSFSIRCVILCINVCSSPPGKCVSPKLFLKMESSTKATLSLAL